MGRAALGNVFGKVRGLGLCFRAGGFEGLGFGVWFGVWGLRFVVSSRLRFRVCAFRVLAALAGH